VCEFATSTEKVPITTPGHHGWYWQRVCIIANLIGHQGKCALCPVPALVAAVRASKEFLESRGVQAAFLLQGLHGGASPWRKGGKLIDEILNAALADLVARVEKMEAAK